VYRGTTIGDNCLLGDTACIREQVRIGDACIIAMGVTVNYNTTIGSRVKVMDNSHLTGNMVIEDDVFISTLVTTTNDNSMGREAALNVPEESRQRQGPIIRRNVTIGQSACILPGIEIGENTIVGANAVVTRPLPPRVLALGVPARVIRDLREDEIKS
jgi:acetyltransferase-like isoleucine patch superfamily enzyme